MPDVGTSSSERVGFCVCIPARNEARRLTTVASALAAQTWPGVIPVSIVINNSNDDSAAVVRREAARHEGRLAFHVEEVTFPQEIAHAGSARRMAMDKACALAVPGEHFVLVSTDADARPPPEWLERTANAVLRGAGIVGGRIAIDPDDALPPNVGKYWDAWADYWQTVRAIEDSIDPLPWDPPPRHGDHTGASLAIRADLYALCGGVPLLPTGEDVALVAAAVAAGGTLVHPPDVFTYVSPRCDGRAQGGMSCHMVSLFDDAAHQRRPSAPAFDHWRQRALWRRWLRNKPDGNERIALLERSLDPMPNDMVLEIGI